MFLMLLMKLLILHGKGLDKELNDGIYITLTDHINYAIEMLQGINVQNPLLWEIR